MAFEQKDNAGSLFKNDKKQSETHADYAGTVMIGGKEMWINAWLKKTKNGGTYMSLSFRDKVAKAAKHKTPNQKTPAQPERPSSSEIPF